MKLLQNKKILIVAPHQDDEVLGCGGLIAYAIEQGSTVEVVHVFAGTTGISYLPNGEQTSTARRKEAQAAADDMGFTLYKDLGFVDRTNPSENEVQRALINVIRRSSPDVLLLPHADESDVEHAMVSRVGKQAAWLSAAHIETGSEDASIRALDAVLYYSVWTPLSSPTLYLDITNFIDKKQRALSKYVSQMEATSWEHGSIGINAYFGTKLLAKGYVEVFDSEPLDLGGCDV